MGRTVPSRNGSRNLFECQEARAVRLRLAVADHAGDGQARIVEGGPEGVGQRVAEFPALVDRARQLRRGVARNAAGNENCRNSRAIPSASRGTSG